MQKIQIITDSGCDLDKETIEELGIRVLPFSVSIADLNFKEVFEKSTDDFYELMEKYDEKQQLEDDELDMVAAAGRKWPIKTQL